MSVNIHKVKLSGDKASVFFTRKTKGTTENGELTSEEGVRPEFHAAMSALEEHVVALCELPADYVKDIKVISVSISDKDDILGAVITAKKKLTTSRSPFIIHTPHKLATNNAGRTNEKCLSVECVRCVEDVVAEAEKFLKGSRAQKEMFNGEEEAA